MSGVSRREHGQILVLFAGMMVVLLGLSALAVDVSFYYSSVRHERAVADAAALAGAQDNFKEGTDAVGNDEWTNARTSAMRTAIAHLRGVNSVTVADLPACSGITAPYAANFTNCPVTGTPYYVSVAAPAPTCQAGGCDNKRSVQVTVRNPRHSVAFATIFGQSSWNATQTSVAERSRGSNYHFVTLRPPKPRRNQDPSCAPSCDANEGDISLDGTNTKLSVLGDMGTNTNMVLTAGATVSVGPDSYVNRFDAYKAWSGPPPDKQLSAPIPDPNYPYPARPTNAALNFADEAAARLATAACEAEVAKIPATYGVAVADVAAGLIACYKPGSYNFNNFKPPSGIRTAVFTPGVYFLNGGLTPGSNVRVIGGYDASTSGVAFVFKATCNPACTFAGNGAPLVALNAGNAYPSGTGAQPTAAVNWDGTVVQTTGRTPVPMTLLVERHPDCVVATTDSGSCPENQLSQINLPGGGNIFIFGVQYGPSDNMKIAGGSGSDGYLGQVWAWTVQYTGGSNINLVGSSNHEPGVLRIATPCSPGTTCVNPEATVPLP